jgi:uncharacterized cupin superfamily protein
VDEVAPEPFQHDVDPGARRLERVLHSRSGLTRQALRHVLVAAGARSTAYHTHERSDEWVYVLAGRAAVRVGGERFEVGAGDFLGHPAGGPPHQMEPLVDLEYLMGGMIDPDDVVHYPEAGLCRAGGRLEPS